MPSPTYKHGNNKRKIQIKLFTTYKSIALKYTKMTKSKKTSKTRQKFDFPVRGSTQVLLCLFPGVLWLWHFLYSVSPHPLSSLHIYSFVVSRAFMAGAASQAGDADSSRAPGLTSGLQGSVNVHCGALLLVP